MVFSFTQMWRRTAEARPEELFAGVFYFQLRFRLDQPIPLPIGLRVAASIHMARHARDEVSSQCSLAQHNRLSEAPAK